MATQTERITALAQGIGGDIKALTAKVGDLSQLSTTAKTTIVAALNELQAEINAVATGTGNIDDGASASSTTTTYSASKITQEIQAAITALVNGAPTALDTLAELASELNDQDSAVANLVTALDNRVRFDAAQSLTTPQQGTARSNIAAAAAADLTALVTSLGTVDTDYVAIYNAAKA